MSSAIVVGLWILEGDADIHDTDRTVVDNRQLVDDTAEAAAAVIDGWCQRHLVSKRHIITEAECGSPSFFYKNKSRHIYTAARIPAASAINPAMIEKRMFLICTAPKYTAIT